MNVKSNIKLKSDLVKELLKRDLKIVDDPIKAKYLLNVNVLFADNLKEVQALKMAMGVL